MALPPPRRDDRGILAGPLDAHRRRPAPPPDLDAPTGLAVEHRSGFTGTVVGWDGPAVGVRDRREVLRWFRPEAGAFRVAGRAVTLRRPVATPSRGPAPRTASGSLAVAGQRARVARAGRILVEGVHDAELVERVWGDDLRVEGVVVERLDGVDGLAEAIAAQRPGPGRRLGVLVDHLVPGSKEARLAATVADPHVLVTGTPYVDVWQAIRPAAVGIAQWPDVPRDRPWKEGVCEALGLGPPGPAWRRLLAAVGDWRDLEAPLVGAVERLIDFVTAD